LHPPSPSYHAQNTVARKKQHPLIYHVRIRGFYSSWLVKRVCIPLQRFRYVTSVKPHNTAEAQEKEEKKLEKENMVLDADNEYYYVRQVSFKP